MAQSGVPDEAEITAIYEVGQALVGTFSLDELLARAARTLAKTFDADAYLMLPNAARTHLVARAVAGAHPELLGRELPLDAPGASLGAWVFHHKQPVTVEDSDADERTWLVRKATGGRAYLGVALVVRDQAIGSVMVVETRGPRRFSDDEVRRCSAIAGQLAVAVENARLYDDLRKSYAELERTQSQLMQNERLAALGELSAIVAHEMRNPLGAIFNSVAALKRADAPPPYDEMVGIIGEEAERLNRIVGDLIEFARPRSATLTVAPLEPIISDALQAALREQGPLVRVVREVDPSLPPVPVDARLLRQALINLFQNAVQALAPGGGVVTVRARVAEAPSREVELQIRDDGPGILPSVMPRIFEPFFSTRATGTGLGLALVKRVMDKHFGKVDVSSEPGAGTKVTLHLPLEVRA